MPPTTRTNRRGSRQSGAGESRTAQHDDNAAGSGQQAGDGVAAGVRQTAGGVAAGMQQAAQNVSGVVNPKRLLWFGGLAAVGALGVIDWPVVAAIGAGTYIAEQLAKDDVRDQVQHA